MDYVILSLFGLALVALSAMGLFYGERQHAARLAEKADHAKCIAHVTSVMSGRLISTVLHDLAGKWDTVDNEADLARIRNTKYKAGGPSVVALWLAEEAQRRNPSGVLFIPEEMTWPSDH